jgi:hypothetical protein
LKNWNNSEGNIVEVKEVAQDGVAHMVLEVIMVVIMVDIHLNILNKCSKILLLMT